MQALGFILGPLNTVVSATGYEWHDAKLYFNLYTGPGFLGIFLSALNIVFIIFFFKEFDVHNTKTRIPLWQMSCCSADENRKIVKSKIWLPVGLLLIMLLPVCIAVLPWLRKHTYIYNTRHNYIHYKTCIIKYNHNALNTDTKNFQTQKHTIIYNLYTINCQVNS